MTKTQSHYCLACKKKNADKSSITLLNGSHIHNSCYDKISSKIEKLQTGLAFKELSITQLSNEIHASETLWGEIKSLFSSNEKLNIEEAESKISIYRSEIENIKSNIDKRNIFFSSIYDYWPTYPPDWHERREKIFSNRGQHCQECRSSYASYDLHIHHKTPIARGGNHKLDNLSILCESCHSHKHGGKQFTYNVDNRTPVFSSRIERIQSAIHSSKDISFLYKKTTQKKFHKRHIKPYKIVSIPHIHDNDDTICVKGFCYKRNSDRIFAIKRMKALKS